MLKREGLNDTKMKQESLIDTRKESGPKSISQTTGCSLASQISSLDKFLDQKIKILAVSRQSKKWKRRAQDKPVPFDSQLFSETKCSKNITKEVGKTLNLKSCLAVESR